MSNSKAVSLEFFPPKTDAGRVKLVEETLPALSVMNPEYCSVTYGAGGSTRDTTVGVVNSLKEAGQDVAPHLSFGSDNEETMLALLNQYKDAGIKRLVALRGDAPSGMGGGGQLVHANELVEFIRKHTGDHFTIAVAAYPEIHPEAKSYDRDIHFLKQKLDAGADYAVTQFFYNVESYFYFLDACQAAGIDKPIHPGIMPILNIANLERFASACGAEIPRWIKQRAAAFGDDQESIRKFGVDVVTQLCATLQESGAPGVHFYTMNQVEPTLTIARNLGLA